MVISRRVEGISRKVSQYIYIERELWVPATPPVLLLVLLGRPPLLTACLYLAISSSLCSIIQLPLVVDHQLVPLPDEYVHYLPLGKLVPLVQIENMLISGKIYTTGKNFTLPPAVTAVTNITSARDHI